MTGKRKSHVSSQYWLDIAAQALAEHGPDALTIDALCLRAGKTKGSFYAHFANHDAFLSALVKVWRKRNTDQLIEASNEAPEPQDRLAALNALAVRLDVDTELGMRALAARNLLVQNVVQEVDALRIAHLASLYEATGAHIAADAKALATVEYAAFVGLQHIRPRQKPEELAALYKAFTRLVARGS